MVSHEKMESIIRSCDVYASASRAEGYDSATLTAMAMEKVVIGVPFGIKGDYLNSTNSLLCDYSLEPVVDSAAAGYDAYQMWSRPNLENLIEQMRTAYRLVKDKTARVNMLNAFTAADLGKNARAKVASKYFPEANTPSLAKIFTEIQNEVKEKYTSKVPT
jgi:glycosyltransferase involved in cell wall biosynthesis